MILSPKLSELEQFENLQQITSLESKKKWKWDQNQTDAIPEHKKCVCGFGDDVCSKIEF